MKKFLLLFILICFLISPVIAQSGAKTIFFEAGGPGLASINYDMRISPKQDGLGFRVGLGGFSFGGEGALFIPVGLNYLLGKDGKNYFELGGGFTGVTSTDNTDDFLGSSFGHLNFGYRLQPANGGFLFRAAIVPVFTSEGFIPYYGGISFGYKF